jgi:hypothetical protein
VNRNETIDFLINKVRNGLTGVSTNCDNIMWNGMGCLYRYDNGNRCLIGWLIPDDKYHNDMEGDTVEQTLIKNLVGTTIMNFNLSELRNIQCKHDGLTGCCNTSKDAANSQAILISFLETFKI